MTTPIENEAVTFTTVVVEWDGEVYEIPEDSRNWPLDVMDAQEAGKNIGMVAGLLGAEQYAKYRSKPRTMGDFEDFTTKLLKASLAGK